MSYVDRYLNIVSHHAGRCVHDGARVLDFGCGTGATVHALIGAGYDAWGVDVVQAWDAHDRLKVVSSVPYRLPFPDGHFDFIISEQVMEHVFDYDTVFSELRRVLKPSGLSIHHFPGPLYYYEGHLNVPLVALCRSRAYLMLCALVRSKLKGTPWRTEYASFRWLMSLNNYPSKHRLRRAAHRTRLIVDFVEGYEFFSRRNDVLTPLQRVCAVALSPWFQRLMILRPRLSSDSAV